MVLTCNIDTNLEPTLDFYIDALGDKSEALALVTRNPGSFSRSLEKRLKPRVVEAKDAGMILDYACMLQIVFFTKEKWDKKASKAMAANE